jgi:multicomponent Na+:H+ antiporter subunit E
MIAYLPVLLWQVIVAGVDTLISLVYVELPIKPGMVKVKTTLTGDTALTLLSYLISLSPGTLTVETDRAKGYICVHWRNVASENIEETTRLIVAKHERMLALIFGKK